MGNFSSLRRLSGGTIFPRTDWVYLPYMAANKDEIFRTALGLSEAERADLVEALLDSLDAAVETGVEEAWRAEIERRSQELETGAVQSIPWDVVRQRLARV
jgi:putative addiction module component (TIGR02574 family)